MPVLVIDVGSSSVRASEVRVDGTMRTVAQISTPPLHLGMGLIEIDAEDLARKVVEVAEQAIAVSGGSLEAVAIASQRATSILWDHHNGVPAGNGISWQDLRTSTQCLLLRTQGIELAPNESASKFQYLISQHADKLIQPRLGTIDTFVAYILSGGDLFITDLTNAATTGLMLQDGTGYDTVKIEQLGLKPEWLPEIVPHGKILGSTKVLTSNLPIVALIGDQQASLVGQGCVLPGRAKLTLGTGAMLDLFVGPSRPAFPRRGEYGSFPVAVQWDGNKRYWGVEAIGLSAGSTVDWMVGSMGLAPTVADTESLALAASPTDTTIMVPSLAGQGAPAWDFGARGAFFRMGRATSVKELFRACFRGIAHMAADLLDAAESDGGLKAEHLCVDGKMATNRAMIEELSTACGIDLVVSGVIEATTLGAGLMGLISLGQLDGLEQIAELHLANHIVKPTVTRGSVKHNKLRDEWYTARDQSLGEIPELSVVSF